MKKAWILFLSLLLLIGLVLGLSLGLPRLMEEDTATTTAWQGNEGETELDWFS